jgi:hypothetical protein
MLDGEHTGHGNVSTASARSESEVNRARVKPGFALRALMRDAPLAARRCGAEADPV